MHVIKLFTKKIFTNFFIGNVECHFDIVYSNDNDVKLEIIKEKDEKIGNVHIIKCHFLFDFMNKRKGYIIHVNNIQSSKYLRAKFGVTGRLRGENEKSIISVNTLYSPKELSEIKNKKAKAGRIFSYFYQLSIVVILCILGIATILNNSILWGIIVIGITILLIFQLFCYNISKSMPLALKIKYKRFLKKLNFKEIIAKNDLIDKDSYSKFMSSNL